MIVLKIAALCVVGFLALLGLVDVWPLMKEAALAVWQRLPGVGMRFGGRADSGQVAQWARVTQRGVRLWGVYLGWTFVGVMRCPKLPPAPAPAHEQDEEETA